MKVLRLYLFLVILFNSLTLKSQPVWVNTIHSNGSIVGSYRITGHNDNSNVSEKTYISTSVSINQVVKFDWTYITNDGASRWDPFYYKQNGGGEIILTSDPDIISGSGSEAILITSSGEFQLGIISLDGLFGAGTVTITNLRVEGISLTSPIATLTSNCTILAPSAATTFDVTGSSLSSTVTVSAPTGFEISESQNSGYASSLSLTTNGSGTVSSTLYVRLSAGYGGGISGTITASSAGAITQTTTVSSTIVAPPSFSTIGPFSICKEATYLVALSNPNAYNGWSTSDPSVFSVNSSGFITATASSAATATITYTDACGRSVSQTVSIQPATPSLPISDNRVAFKFNGSPQGPTAGSATINYVGYDGYTYLSQTQPIQVGYYKANIQLGDEAGCPNRFYIFNCTTCNN
jgi:hypothetical protein